MRYGIFADVHGNLEALDAVIGAYETHNIDRYLCVGDVVGYGANPRECLAKVKSLALGIVAGNHDWAVVDLFGRAYFNAYAKTALEWTAQALTNEDKAYLKSWKLLYRNDHLTLVHGTLQEPERFYYMVDSDSASGTFALLTTTLCFVGHSHVAGTFIRDAHGDIEYQEAARIDIIPKNRYIINVGSVGQPRDGDPQSSYCIYDTTKNQVEFKRIEYDIASAKKKILAAGLPMSLAGRLLQGK